MGLFALVHPWLRACFAYYDYLRMLREAHALNPTYFYVGYKFSYFVCHALKKIPEARAPGWHWYAPGVWEVYEIEGVKDERAIRAWIETDNKAREKNNACDWLRSQWQALRLRYLAYRSKGREPEDD
jgi:hypothetical protein